MSGSAPGEETRRLTLGQPFVLESGAVLPEVSSEVFGRQSDAPGDFAVNGWLRHHGGRLVERFDANSYRVLLDAMDTHDLARRRGDYAAVLQSIRQPVLVGSLASDALYCPSDQRGLAHLIPGARLLNIASSHGHDGFLIDADAYQADLLAFKHQAARPRVPGGTRPAPPGAPDGHRHWPQAHLSP